VGQLQRLKQLATWCRQHGRCSKHLEVCSKQWLHSVLTWLQMLPSSTAGGGLLSEDQSWGRLLVKLPLRHPSKQNKSAGEIELEVGPAAAVPGPAG